jgi:hypothetical protein
MGCGSANSSEVHQNKVTESTTPSTNVPKQQKTSQVTTVFGERERL